MLEPLATSTSVCLQLLLPIAHTGLPASALATLAAASTRQHMVAVMQAALWGRGRDTTWQLLIRRLPHCQPSVLLVPRR